MYKIQKFQVDFGAHRLVGDIIGGRDDISILFLHGAGKSIRQRYESMRMMLYEKGFSSCAFDFTGHGETGGVLQESSLLERTEQSCRVIEQMKIRKPLIIVANSMSGYTGVKLLEVYDVESLILIVPAAYDRDAYKLRFNAGFTECIRKERSYLDSDAWQILRDFKGRLMIISAENDAVIPDEVIDRYYVSAVNAKDRKLITVKDSPHAILAFMEDNRDVLKSIVDEMAAFINKAQDGII